jgi:hypothetical protein
VAVRDQLGDEVRSKGAGGAGNEDLHGLSFRSPLETGWPFAL